MKHHVENSSKRGEVSAFSIGAPVRSQSCRMAGCDDRFKPDQAALLLKSNALQM
jgi:hypothetical protein